MLSPTSLNTLEEKEIEFFFIYLINFFYSQEIQQKILTVRNNKFKNISNK